MKTSPSFHLRAGAAFILSAAACASAADLQLIYSEIVSSPTSVIAGALDANGQPVTARWTSILGLAVRENGDEWVVRGLTDLPSDIQWATARGTGTSGAIFQQEGQPVLGGNPGEVWNAFVDDPPVSWNAAGIMAYSARARFGVPVDEVELVGTFDGTTHTIVHREGDAVTNLPGCTSPSLGNSIASVQMLDTGLVAYGNTPITGCSSFFYPALFHGTAAVVRTGTDPILAGAVGEEIIFDGSYSTAAFSVDGSHYLWPITTNNPNAAQNTALVLDGNVVLREGLPVASSSLIMDATFNTNFALNGDWYARGDAGTTSTAPDWAVRNGVLLAKTGDPITTGATELWGDAIGSFRGRSNGDWVISGNTDNPDTNANAVIVLNGSEVLVREGDPVDVDGNGLFDDDAFINTFGPNSASLTDSNILYFRCTLRNGAGTSLGDALIRSDLNPAVDCPADIVADNVVDVSDLLAVITAWGSCVNCPKTPCASDIAPLPSGDCEVDVSDLLLVITSWGACP